LHKNINIFFTEIEHVYNLKSPFVVYRKPDENKITAYIQNSNIVHELNSFNENGFVFAPFHKDGKKIFFPLKDCMILTSEINDVILVNNTSKNVKQQFKTNEDSKQMHIKLVQNGIDFIKNNKAKKIVLSRKEKVEYTDFDVINTLKKMLNIYKNAFVYLWYHPTVGLWMGATPERLISIKKNTFKTMALAGTKLNIDLESVIWQDKEKEEQQFVTDYILDTIKSSIGNIKISKPYTVQAGDLLHIRTDISGELISNKLLENLIDSLHPTPAVCGLPKDIATQFISEKEGYNRTFYTGYLGELNINNQTNLFVNLRCMKIESNSASIYVGGGITKSSNSIKEWEETVNKAEIMKRVLA